MRLAQVHSIQAIADDLVHRCRVRRWVKAEARNGGGLALCGQSRICPVPVDSVGLYLLAHECGHIALKHQRKISRHRGEYEAEQFANFTLAAYRIPIPKQCITHGKKHVAETIRNEIDNRGVRLIDEDSFHWSEPYLGDITILLNKGKIQLESKPNIRRFKALVNDMFRFDRFGTVSFCE